jgi:ABC-type glycerol-3-phosphate transport system substrate-binding protein
MVSLRGHIDCSDLVPLLPFPGSKDAAVKGAVRLILILVLAVTACGAEQGESTRAGAVDGDANPIQLTLWHAYGGAFGEQFEALVDAFNRAHPGIRVQPSYGGSLWTMRDKLFTAVSGGAAPDLAQIDQFWSSELAEAGAIVRFEDGFGEFERDDVWPLAWDTAAYQGEIWSMPFSLSNIVLYYNRARFRDAGLDPDDPPATWERLAATAAALTADIDGDGQSDRWGFSFPLQASQGVVYYWFAFLWQAGGEIFTKDFSASRFQEAPGVAALAFWQSMVKAGSIPLAPPEEGFERGQIGMTLASTARLSRYVLALGEDLGVAPLAAGAAGKVTGVGGANLAIMADCEDKQAAWTFVEWMTSPEVNLRWSTGTGYLPLRHSVVASDGYQQYLADEPRARVILEQMNVARARPNIPQYAGASREVGLAVEEALFTGVDPAAVLAAAAEKVDRILGTGKPP